MHVLAISIEPFQMSQNLMQAPKTLKEYISQYQENRKSLDMKGKKIKEPTFNTFFQLYGRCYIVCDKNPDCNFDLNNHIYAMQTIQIKISSS